MTIERIQKHMFSFNPEKLEKNELTVADIFCGAGGFSEGFRQMGFKVVFGLDFWKPAIETHKLNHPNCNTVKTDILKLDTPKKIDEIIPDTDIIIGGPPCVAFSGSNKAGFADKTMGMELIKAYLRIIAWKKSKGTLKYWILENVPNSKKYIESKYTWKDLDLPGEGPELKIPVREIINAAECGAPQTRARFFCGDYPLPKKIPVKDNKLFISKIFEDLGNPLEQPKKRVKDSVYKFTILGEELTDHFYDSRVSEFEWKKAKRLKEDHGFMGKMAFPEETNRLSRTVMATLSTSTREAMLFKASNKEGKGMEFRLPTIREVASFMSFPITYQFEANTITSKFRLVGNAVCPKVAAALAEAIANKEGIQIPSKFIPLPNIRPRVSLNGMQRKKKKPKSRNFDSKFAIHVPYLKIRSYRVELNNKTSDFKNKLVRWRCILHKGTGSSAQKTMVKQRIVEEILSSNERFAEFQKAIKENFEGGKMTTIQLQEAYCKNDDNIGPFRYLEEIKELVDKFYPDDIYFTINVDNSDRKIAIDDDEIPIRILAALYACNYFVNMLTKN